MKINILIAFAMLLVIGTGIVIAASFNTGKNTSHLSEITEGKKLVEANADCNELSDEQLEAIGEYLMEQMHPGDSHDAMHEMMGMVEGTEEHETAHINMAKMMYCGESEGMNNMPGMMSNCMEMMGKGMNMNGNMMNMHSNINSGMMGSEHIKGSSMMS